MNQQEISQIQVGTRLIIDDPVTPLTTRLNISIDCISVDANGYRFRWVHQQVNGDTEFFLNNQAMLRSHWMLSPTQVQTPETDIVEDLID